MQLTYELFKQKAEEAKAKFPGKKVRGTRLPKVAGLKVNNKAWETIKTHLEIETPDKPTSFLVHNYLRITSSPCVPENMIVCLDAKGTIIGAVKFEAKNE